MSQPFYEGDIKKMHFFEVWSWCGRLSVFSRSSVGKIRQGIREGKETAICKKWYNIGERLEVKGER